MNGTKTTIVTNGDAGVATKATEGRDSDGAKTTDNGDARQANGGAKQANGGATQADGDAADGDTTDDRQIGQDSWTHE